MTAEQAEAFAGDLIAAWNARDLERILAHYSDEVVLRCQYAVRLMGTPSGVIEGKDAVRTFFARGLAANPDLRYEPLEVLPGAGSVAVRYLGLDGREAIQVFEIDRAGKIRRAASHFSGVARVAAERLPAEAAVA